MAPLTEHQRERQEDRLSALEAKRDGLKDGLLEAPWKMATGALDVLVVDKHAKKTVAPLLKMVEIARAFSKAVTGFRTVLTLESLIQTKKDQLSDVGESHASDGNQDPVPASDHLAVSPVRTASANKTSNTASANPRISILGGDAAPTLQ